MVFSFFILYQLYAFRNIEMPYADVVSYTLIQV